MSPILTIQQRHAEHGRIRIGQKVSTRNGKTRPDKLDRFRFTSGNRAHIEALATLYGGQAKEWQNGSKTEYEVITEARAIPVIAVKNGVSQWLETWSGGGCTHRCDGFHNVLTDSDCDPRDPDHVNAKPTTRLSVMLRDLESLGVWRLESHGWNAAAEIPSMAELATFVGDYVPAQLVLQQRTSVRDGKTSQYVVPVLDLAITKHRLNEAIETARTGAPAIASAAAPTEALQIEQAPTDYTAELDACTTIQCCRDLWEKAGAAGALTDDLKEAITERVAALTPSDPTTEGETSDGETVEAEVVDERDEVWQQVVAAAGKVGIAMSELAREVESNTGKKPSEATVEDLRVVLELLTTGATA